MFGGHDDLALYLRLEYPGETERSWPIASRSDESESVSDPMASRDDDVADPDEIAA